jgi:hypothetical protein
LEADVTTIQIKRGDTLRLPCRAWAAEGVPQPLAGWSIRSQVRYPSGALAAALEVVITDEDNGFYDLIARPEVTDLWKLGAARMDIEYTTPAGDVSSTETFRLSVKRDETR